MHPAAHARSDPDKPAIIVAETGAVTTFADLDRASNRAAHLFRAEGLGVGDVVAVLLDNDPRTLEIAWGAQRAGLYLVGISTKLTPTEVAHILRDSGARLLVTAPAFGPSIGDTSGLARFMIDDAAPGFRAWDAAVAAQPDQPIADERAGADMLYSSGTTGVPKGVRPALPADPDIAAMTAVPLVAQRLGFGADTIYLTPAPLYHAAPLRWSMAAQKLGGTVVLMRKFDPEGALAAIARYRVTHGQWVPTHFVRLLKLPEEVRTRYDTASMRLAIHAAAPCPIPVKRAMIDWWGSILVEYYAATEGNGMTLITSPEWLDRPGSVGRAAFGVPHICGEDGEELPVGEEGLVYFSDGPAFAYHNDPAKTAAATNAHGWTTLGDVGRLDAEGYLTLTDRKSFMIISGGVNIYPAEVENLLVTHPAVMDAAVIGAPDDEMGERVVAVVQPVDCAAAGPGLAAELTAWLRPRLSGVKLPRQIDFVDELPRQPTGKLYKRLVRDRYWAKE